MIELMAAASGGGVSSSIDRGVPMAERLLLGLQTTLLGLGTVFSVLIILMCVLFLFRLFFYSIPNRRNKNKNVVDSSVNDDSEATVPLVSASTVKLLLRLPLRYRFILRRSRQRTAWMRKLLFVL